MIKVRSFLVSLIIVQKCQHEHGWLGRAAGHTLQSVCMHASVCVCERERENKEETIGWRNWVHTNWMNISSISIYLSISLLEPTTPLNPCAHTLGDNSKWPKRQEILQRKKRVQLQPWIYEWRNEWMKVSEWVSESWSSWYCAVVCVCCEFSKHKQTIL